MNAFKRARHLKRQVEPETVLDDQPILDDDGEDDCCGNCYCRNDWDDYEPVSPLCIRS
jgi:hypothetical protein